MSEACLSFSHTSLLSLALYLQWPPVHFLFLCQMLLFTGNWRLMFTRNRNRNTIKPGLIDDLAYSPLFPVVLLIYRTQRLIWIYIACIFPGSLRNCSPLLRLTKPVFFPLYSVVLCQSNSLSSNQCVLQKLIFTLNKHPNIVLTQLNDFWVIPYIQHTPWGAGKNYSWKQAHVPQHQIKYFPLNPGTGSC